MLLAVREPLPHFSFSIGDHQRPNAKVDERRHRVMNGRFRDGGYRSTLATEQVANFYRFVSCLQKKYRPLVPAPAVRNFDIELMKSGNERFFSYDEGGEG